MAALDGNALAKHGCWFGGGTCIALRFGEYRESLDMDFLVSDPAGYRELRQQLTGIDGLAPITRPGATPLQLVREVRADQYGLRTQVRMDGHAIKFEIVREARITLQAPGAQDQLCGIGTLTALDMATSKLLANADRQADNGVFSRDVIDESEITSRISFPIHLAVGRASARHVGLKPDLRLTTKREVISSAFLNASLQFLMGARFFLVRDQRTILDRILHLPPTLAWFVLFFSIALQSYAG